MTTSRKMSEKLPVGQTTRVSSSFGLIGNRVSSSAKERITVLLCAITVEVNLCNHNLLSHVWENFDFLLFSLP